MKGAERRDELLRMLRSNGYLSPAQAAERLGVDGSTIRRDLSRLQELGLIRRNHGVALPQVDEADEPYRLKINRQLAEKQAIARAVAGLIPDGATVILDAGSTTLMVARALTEHRGLTVITADVRIAAELIFRPVRLIMTGGEVLEGTSTLVSQESVETMSRYHVDVAVMAVDGVDQEVASNLNAAVVPLKKAMIRAAQRRILAADRSKFGIRKLVTVARVDEFDEIVTDDAVPDGVIDDLRISVHRAPTRKAGQDR